MPTDDFAAQNRRSWNAVVPAHASHRGDAAAFFRAGGSTLFPEECALLGDLSGMTLAHLLCNTGRDSLSLAQRGAVVTGVDLSDVAIAAARQLTAATGIAATFHCADVYEWLDETARAGKQFDIVFCSYGAICWLVDVDAWARGVAAVLRPGGRFVVVDFHPAAAMFDRQWQHRYPYPAGGERLTSRNGVEDYVASAREGLTPTGFVEGVQGFTNPHPCHLFRWGLGEIVTALIDAGLSLTALREYPYINGERLFARMRALPGRRVLPPEDVPRLPLMYGIAARKPDHRGGLGGDT